MGLISLQDMHFYAYHGVYDEEQIIGNDYWIDLTIDTDFGGAEQSDDLGDTINYETVYFICKSEMSKPRRLLEKIGADIVERLKFQFDNIQQVQITIRKQNPPLGGKVGFASIEISDEFVQQCGRCGKGLVCYSDENCWCQNFKIHPETQLSLKKQFKGCLCKKCLSLYKN